MSRHYFAHDHCTIADVKAYNRVFDTEVKVACIASSFIDTYVGMTTSRLSAVMCQEESMKATENASTP